MMIRVGDIDLSAEALLGRSCWSLDWDDAAIRARCGRALITGAGGSVGGFLAARLATARVPLVLCDSDENGLDRLARRVPPGPDAHYRLADVADAHQVRELFERDAVDTVFHLAAKKHVKYAEDAPRAAALTNVLGTVHLLEAALAHGVQRWVVASSDKAALAHNVLGRTKRLAEQAAIACARDTNLPARAVRFCNILGTAGNVLDHFLDHARAGRPLPVWSQDMTRYFCASGEAVDLLLLALDDARMAQALYSLDTGPPTPIAELAERFLEGLHAATGLEGGYEVLERFDAMHVRHELLWRDDERPSPAESPPTPVGLEACAVPGFEDFRGELADALRASESDSTVATLLEAWTQ